MLLLISVGILSLLFGNVIEAAFMVFIVGAYIFVESLHTRRSDRIMAKLRELTQPRTKVVRQGIIVDIPTTDIVVGDIIILTEGTRVPADIRLLESFSLQVNEASITGESLPVHKDARQIIHTSSLPERSNRLFAGTIVLSGEAKGIVIAIGGASQLGLIAHSLQTQKTVEKTPIQEAMNHLTKILAVTAIVVSFLIPLLGYIRGLRVDEMIVTWLALTFLMVPGQPPIIITMALALASFELAKIHVIVKRLRGVERLGQVTDLVIDKTGTITENTMRVERFILANGASASPLEIPFDLRSRLELCLPVYSGDPTDLAVLKALDLTGPRRPYTAFKGFSDNHPWRSLSYSHQGSTYTAIAGEPEAILASSSLSAGEKEPLLQTVLSVANKGYRIIAFAVQEAPEIPWTFLALAVISDPVRQGAAKALAAIRSAGITTRLVTGDHPSTAARVWSEIGMKGTTIQGDEIDRMKDAVLRRRFSDKSLCARTSISQKERLVKILMQPTSTVAVMGDGVNDAPALHVSDLGIALGEIGTDLAKEAADLILTDDNFNHLPRAIAIGRKALDNFRKGLSYYLTAKAILLSIFLVPLVLGIPFPLAPIHLIIIELLMDLASSTIFVSESAEPRSMSGPQTPISSYLQTTLYKKILTYGAPLSIGLLSVYLWIYLSTGNLIMAQTAAFVTWLIGHIGLALQLKQERRSLFSEGIFRNRLGVLWFSSVTALAICISAVPLFHPFVKTTTLPWNVWCVIGLILTATTSIVELSRRSNSNFIRKSGKA